MSGSRVGDELLRRRAMEALGPLGDELARAALEHGSVSVEHDVLAWEGSHGTMHAHRVFVTMAPDLRERVVASHAALDNLSAALSAAMSERAGQAVADVRVEGGVPDAPASGPYRSARTGRP